MNEDSAKSPQAIQNQLVDSSEINLIDLARYIFNHRLIVLTFTLALPTLAIIWSAFVRKPLYKSHAIINVNLSSKSQSISMARLSYWFEEQETLNKIYLTEQFFSSKKYREAFFDEIEGKTHFCEQKAICKQYRRAIQEHLSRFDFKEDEEKSSLLTSYLEIFSDADKYSMTITAQSPDSYLSQALTDLAAIVLVELNQKVLHERTSRVKKFLEYQTEETRAELESLEKSLVSLQRDKNILASPEVLIKLNNVFVDEKTHLEEIKRKYKASELFLSQISFEINKLREEMASDGNTSQLYLSQAQRRFDLLKYQLAVEQIGRQPSSVSNQGEIVSLTSELNTYKSILRNSKGGSIALDPWKQLQEFESLLAETKKNKAQLASEIQAARTSMRLSEAEHDDIPEAFRQISELQRNIQLTTEIYTMLRTRLAETQIQEAGRSNDLTIMSYADRSRKPTEVGIVKKGVIAGFGGFSLSIMGLFLFYILIPTIRNKSDLEKIGIKVVGEYNLYRSPHSRILGDKTKPLVFVESAGGSEANAIRYTRFRIEKALKINRSLSAPEARVISVCSVNTGEGKTFSISNLAYSFAMADIKTLLFDCDFEKDDLRNYFREMRKPDELAIINDDENIKFERNFIFKNLHLLRICDSSVNLLDYLESTKFHQFLESLRSEYDVIIIDSPPIKGHLTPVILAKEADAVLWVASQRSVIRDDIVFNTQKLRETYKGPIFGILNFTYEDIVTPRKNKKKVA